ncbi:MAG: hypothetical protein AVDCRST_MAG59-2293, partial [uncultured Thermomicrobiales bacterium]
AVPRHRGPPGPPRRGARPLPQLRAEAGGGARVRAPGAARLADAGRRPGGHGPPVLRRHGRFPLSARRGGPGRLLRDVGTPAVAAGCHRRVARERRNGIAGGRRHRPRAAPVRLVRGGLARVEPGRRRWGAGLRAGRSRRVDPDLPRLAGPAGARAPRDPGDALARGGAARSWQRGGRRPDRPRGPAAPPLARRRRPV